MDDNKRHNDNIFPLIYSLLCLCVTAGGVFLVLYVFFPALSRPWQPVAALILIGSPWLVWILTYVYACVKGCSQSRDNSDPQIPIRQAMRSTCASTVPYQKGGGGLPNDDGKDYVASFDSSAIP